MSESSGNHRAASGGGEGEVGWGEGREGKRGGETKGMKAKRGGETEEGEGKQLSNMKFVICRCSIRVVGKIWSGHFDTKYKKLLHNHFTCIILNTNVSLCLSLCLYLACSHHTGKNLNIK